MNPLTKTAAVGLSILLAALPAFTQGSQCYTSLRSHGVEARHCEKAMEKIIYDVNQTLDDVSRSLIVFHKSCAINVQKPRRYTPTRGQVEAAIHNITRSCPSKGGVLVTPSNLITIVHRSTSKNTYEINKPMCEKKRCSIPSQDCMDAFQNLPVNRKGVLLGQQTFYSSNVTRGNCLVKVSTTDYAPFKTSHEEVNGPFRVLLNECKEHSGVVFINGGTAGYNGDVRISIHYLNEQ
ncbi:uncharacterized protein PGTG_15673 [Puccinia graminis f. sp. tritici CRL 75-36-700-3]|uniref:Uncharacterized protein n=1 Tax=Puccinia graminis f. sp. tritici (strain CRL 75-36-700-3 / race SCCL) TaxID=418459 RepID=E3KYZ9_PUCGT|nr:uncharacterized protein PGTG_15673 [Puccinia graminis f. sp. tritici CRL 75-36-700-3]EFP89524.2 hypothetical protein PGTG_15673 [Puccinia graminis f. sp. tritici CRL 75-36-700-3]